MDFEAQTKAILAHYVEMAQIPGAKAQAWHSVKQLAQDHPVLFEDLPEQLTKEMHAHRTAVAPEGTEPQRPGALGSEVSGGEALPAGLLRTGPGVRTQPHQGVRSHRSGNHVRTA